MAVVEEKRAGAKVLVVYWYVGKAVARKVVKAVAAEAIVAAEATVAAMVAAKANGEVVAEKGVEWKVAVVRMADGGGDGKGAQVVVVVTLAEKAVAGEMDTAVRGRRKQCRWRRRRWRERRR